ncbi:MAG: TonB family protein, partial [Cognaticolwellia sp.]
MKITKWLAIPIFIGIAGLASIAVPLNVQQILSDGLSKVLMNIRNVQENRPEDKVYLHSDKPMYKPGETVWFSAYVRDAETMEKSTKSGIVKVQLINPKGGIDTEISIVAKNGVAVGDFDISEYAVGGIYKIKTFTNWQKNDPNPAFFEKEITVQKVVLPRLKMKVDFLKKAYGKGDEVALDLSIQTNENQPFSNTDFNVKIALGGNEFLKTKGKTNDKGTALITFKLPNDLATNDGLVNIIMDYQGQAESISRSIPIVLNNILLQLLPEGGDLVNDLKGRVAFRAANEFGKPADISGVVMNSKGEEITTFESYHQGMGAFELTPKADEKYTVKITKPAGVEKTFDVPNALESGATATVSKVTEDYIYLDIKSSDETKKMFLICQIRGKKYFAMDFEGTHKFTIPTDEMPVGVAQITIFDENSQPIVERLTFVNKYKQLNINIQTNKEKYLPREKVKMTINVTDENGKPTAADLSLSVADDQLLAFADDKSSNILSWLLVESELTEKVEEPNFYFDSKEEKADKALDYLLMTAGWRRYSWAQINADNLPRANYQNQAAIIGGFVYNTHDYKVLENVTVKIKGTNITTKTDKEGHYSFGEIDLAEAKTIEMAAVGYRNQQITVQQYNESNKTYLVNSTIYKKQKKEAENSRRAEAKAKMEAKRMRRPMADGVILQPPMMAVKDEELMEEMVLELPEGIEIEPPRTAEPAPPPPVKNIEEIALKDEKEIIEVKVQNEIVLEKNELDKKVIVDRKPMPKPKPKPKPKPREENVEQIFQVVEQMPRFPGCEDLFSEEEKQKCSQEKLLAYIYQNLKYPNTARENGVEGVAVVSFVVEKDGTISDAKIIRNPGVGLGEEAIRLVNDMNALSNKWTPGKQRNQLIRTQFNLPVRFRLDGGMIVAASGSYYKAKIFPKPIYAGQKNPKVRDDFRSTIYWNGHIEIGKTGRKTIEFYASDAITSFNITAEGIGKMGTVGRKEQKFFTQKPFSLAAKLPTEIVQGDVMKLPLTFVNNSDEAITGELKIDLPEGLEATSTLPKTLTLAPNKAITKFLSFNTLFPFSEKQILKIGFKAKGFQDALETEITIVPKGFPVSKAFSGNELTESFEVNIEDLVDGSLEVELQAYPSIVGEMLTGLEAMLREPHGCFEQTSSSTYPNILVLNYLTKTGQSNPALTTRAKDLIEKGYNRLISFESASGGFEWFGGDPAHEGLTAYGLMEYVDMQSVYDGVDAAMVKRTVNWLFSRRDGKGGFGRNPRALHDFGLTDEATMSIYITWALTQAKFDGLQREIDFAYNTAMQTKQPYQLGLTANILYEVGDKARAKKVLEELMSIQLENGAWEFKA